MALKNTINTTLNIMDEKGNLIPLNQYLDMMGSVLFQPSIIDQVTVKTGKGWRPGLVTRMVKRSQEDAKASAKSGEIGGFKLPTSQHVFSTKTYIKYRTDNIVWALKDILKLKEQKNGNILAQEAENFIITGKELDLKELLAELLAEATAVKLFSAVDTNGAPTGAQPAASGGTEANVIADIAKGLRVVTVDNLDENSDTRLKILRSAIAYLNTIGSPQSQVEDKYPFSINGIGLEKIKILTNYQNMVAIKDSGTVNFINVNGQITNRNITGLVGYIDSKIEMFLTNQIPDGVAYAVMSNRTMIRELDPQIQYIGVVRDGLTVQIGSDIKSLKPSERVVQYEQGRKLGIWYPEEAFFIKHK